MVFFFAAQATIRTQARPLAATKTQFVAFQKAA